MTAAASTPCRAFDVQRFSVHDGPGIRTTVFLEGCPLRCAWCHNPEAFRRAAPERPAAALVAEALRDLPYYAGDGGITLSGGEPLLRLSPARALLAEAKAHGLHACVQTCLAVPRRNVAGVLGLVDLFQVDLKHMDSHRHRELTGAGNEAIAANVAFLLDRGASVDLRMPLLPGLNDDEDNLDRTARFLLAHGVRSLRLVPYHRLYLHKIDGPAPLARAIVPPDAATRQRAARALADRGIDVGFDG